MSLVPNYFKRELNWIDPTYYVVYNQESRTVDVMKNIKERVRRRDGSYNWEKTSLLLAFFKNPNDKALTDLRRRKQLGIKLELDRHPKRYELWCKKLNAENRAKQKELAINMMAEGYKKIHGHNTKKTFI